MAKINDTEKCMKLIENKNDEIKADIHAKGDNYWTALHFACFNGNSEFVSFLLYHEAEIDGLS